MTRYTKLRRIVRFIMARYGLYRSEATDYIRTARKVD